MFFFVFLSQTIEKQIPMIEQLLCQLFSGQCQLKSLRLDISNDFLDGSIHQCLPSNSHLTSKFTHYELQSCCITLRYLYIQLNQPCFLENLIEYVPNLEQMSVQFHSSLKFNSSWETNVETLRQSKENWFSKVRNKRENYVLFYFMNFSK